MLKSIFINILLACTSLLIVFVLLEFVIFRLILVAPQLPTPYWDAGVIKNEPGDNGTYRVRDEIQADFKINAQGWNSGHNEYSVSKRPDTERICVIGDSYVQALQVDTDNSIAEQLEGMLGAGHEVYRFGMGGAPLSQYLHVLRSEVLNYHPDVVVFLLIHNDFTESYRFKPGVYTSSFLKLRVAHGEVQREIEPTQWQAAWYEPLRQSAIWRYLSVRKGLSFSLLRTAILGSDETKPRFEANIDTAALDRSPGDPELVAATRYVFGQIRQLATEHDFTPVLVMDGVRSMIESEATSMFDYDRGALRLNKLARSTADEFHLPFLDLHPVFAGEFAMQRTPFGHAHDAHWNTTGHHVAAEALRDFLYTHKLIPAH